MQKHSSKPNRQVRIASGLRSGAVLVALVLLAACGRSVTSTPGDAPNLEKWVAEVKSRPAPPLDPLPVMQQFETFEYAAQGMRDPFSNAFSDQGNGSGPRPDPDRRKQTLEQFPLDRQPDSIGRLIALAASPASFGRLERFK